MKIDEYKIKNRGELRQATLALLMGDNKILLAMKKRGFGAGKWNGVGGKVKEGENVLQTAIRETEEEIAVNMTKQEEVARIRFYFANKPDWSQEVVVYKVTNWDGEPQESEEMAPKWFGFEEIPYNSMWPDDIHWLPKVLAGKKLRAEFLFGDGEVIEDMKLDELV